MKCNNCKVNEEVENSKAPACCIWYMDNVIIGGKDVEECDCYQEIDGGENNGKTD